MIRVPVAWIEWFDLRRSLATIAFVGGGYGFLLWRTAAHGGSPFGLLAAAPVVAAVLALPAIGLLYGYSDGSTNAPGPGGKAATTRSTIIGSASSRPAAACGSRRTMSAPRCVSKDGRR